MCAVDNISDKVDEFKRAGQMLARARTLTPENGDVGALEKLSAAEALIALQFYDEAERALAQLQTAKLAAVENALGSCIRVSSMRFEPSARSRERSSLTPNGRRRITISRCFIEANRIRRRLPELEAAAALDSSNVNLRARWAKNTSPGSNGSKLLKHFERRLRSNHRMTICTRSLATRSTVRGSRTKQIANIKRRVSCAASGHETHASCVQTSTRHLYGARHPCIRGLRRSLSLLFLLLFKRLTEIEQIKLVVSFAV